MSSVPHTGEVSTALWLAAVLASGMGLVYAPSPDAPEARQALIDLCMEGAPEGTAPGPEDRLLTLSTCTGRGHATRWVVQGVLAEERALPGEY